MNKKLIAVAIAGACAAPVAMAQTAGPVTLYGRVFEEIVSVDAKAGGGNPEIPRRTRIDDQSSLLGVRGTEDLGGGLKAFFQLETAFKADQNDTAFATRNSAVGLQGGWGSFLIGRWDMPYKVSTYPIDAFGDLTMSAISGIGHDQGNFDRRDQNVVQYWSPKFGPIAFKVAATANEGKACTTSATTGDTSCNNPHDLGANVTYTSGPLYAFLAYEDHKDPSAAYRKERGYSGGASFHFGPIKLGGEYERIKRDRSDSALDSPEDRKEWLASVVWTIGANELIYQHQDSKGASTAGTDNSADCKSDTIAYKYIFSKRTFFIAQYMRTDNSDLSTCSFGTTATFPVKPGNDVRAAGIGLQHVF
jgi:predicted porin